MHILKEGDKVGASDATLLNMLNISPFNYGLLVEMVYDSGTVFEPKILDIRPEDLRIKFMEVINSFCLILQFAEGFTPLCLQILIFKTLNIDFYNNMYDSGNLILRMLV